MTEETEVLDTPNYGLVPPTEVLEPTEVSYSFDSYTHEISEDLIVTIYGDSTVVDKSGPFDTLENAEAFAASFVDALSSGDIKPNPVSIEG